MERGVVTYLMHTALFPVEATVRIELMEQVPHIAMYCLENKHLFQDPIPTHLLPIIVKYLTDSNSQVKDAFLWGFFLLLLLSDLPCTVFNG